MPKTKFYAVAKGRKVGVYSTWDECQAQVRGFPGNKYKSFPDRKQAIEFVEPFLDKSASTIQNMETATEQPPSSPPKRPSTTERHHVTEPAQKRTRISSNHNESLCFHITFDGGSRGNPGISGAGAQIISTITTTTTIGPNHPHKITTSHNRRKTDIRHYLGDFFTNNQAEYQGLICALEYVLQALSRDYNVISECPEVTMLVQGDSNLIIQQLKGNYDCKSAKLRPLYQRAKKLVRDITNHTSQKLKVTYEHVYRSSNKTADGTLIKQLRTQCLTVCLPSPLCVSFSTGQRCHGWPEKLDYYL
jgi:ribonuclease HI